MGKKIEVKEKFIVIHDDKYECTRDRLDLAQICVRESELDGAIIYKVVQVWEAQWPEEPEMEFHELTLEQV